MSRILAIDLGSKRIGLAISDETKTIAQTFPGIVVKSQKQTYESLKKIVQEQQVDKILVGLPLNLQGKDSHQTKQTRAFAELLTQFLKNIPIELIDERFSTREAIDKLHFQKIKAKKMRAEIDSMSAQILLETYLRSKKN